MAAAVGLATLGLFGGGGGTSQYSTVDQQLNLNEIERINLGVVAQPFNLTVVESTNLLINVVATEDVVVIEPAE